jgi:hypothetical protein
MYFSIKDQKEELEIYNFCVLIALGLNRETNKKEIIDFLWLVKRPREITRDL